MSFTGTVLKNLFTSSATTKYPAVPKEYPERTRGHIEIDFDDCILCGLCMRSCPPGAIKVNKDMAAKKGSWSIDRFDCIQCGYCASKCPKKCLHIVPGYQEPDYSKHVFSLEKEVVIPAKPVAPAKAAAAAAAASTESK